MGRAIDMENDIQKLNQRLERIEPALEKVINWIAEQENKDDSKKQHESKAVKKPAKTSKKVSDVQEGVEH
jgi:lipid II:glycine glycyltransferase (peptidoglycan interpeptide bridge formation enzyme)